MRRLVSGWLFFLIFVPVAVADNMPSAGSPNELVRGNGTEPGTLDPQHMEQSNEGAIAYDLFEGLTVHNNQGQLVPGQAESWEVSSDGKKWVFKIRKGLRWSDGQPLNARDFEYSFRRLADPETAGAYAWFMTTMAITNAEDVIRGKKAVDQLGVKATSLETLEFNLDNPVYYLPELLTSYAFLPVPRHIIEKKGAKWSLPGNSVSNGAFKLKEWKVNEKIKAVRNPHYKDNKLTRLNSVVYMAGGDVLARFRAGEMHITSSITQEQDKWVQKNKPEWRREEPCMSVGILFLNMEADSLQNINNRRALALALDRKAIANSCALGSAEPAWQIVPPLFEGFAPKRPEGLALSLKERVVRAKRKIKNLNKITISYCASDLLERRTAIAVAQEWKKNLGIDVALSNYEEKAYYEFLDKGQYEVAVIRWIGPYKDPASLLNIWHSKSSNNRSFYYSADFEGFLEKARSMMGHSIERMALYSKAEEQIMKDVPAIPVMHNKNVRLVSDQVGGYTGMNPVGRVYSRYLYLK